MIDKKHKNYINQSVLTRFQTNNHHYISIEFFGLNLMPLRLQNIPSNEEGGEKAALFTSRYNIYVHVYVHVFYEK